ncbi:hypothetical protein PR202_ga31297 [Eleusine coracana subsp. coracana]|uniref:GST C-terminal domain-containing protein n=1 Tax=Eleusine coracana subsp. coracana TaxID=191504 RepID=A0AAV5DRL9_ELECO|nr:hypothetical protein PR202_ga31297 [Eleusine coracana subsp. coracana]
MRSLRAAQILASRSLLLSVRALHSAASAAGAGARLCSQPVLPTRSPSPSSRAVPTGVAGVVSFSLTFASVAAAEAKAKERPPPDLLPQNVVLYQYQACPFCNKVREIINILQNRISPDDELTNEEEAKWRRFTLDARGMFRMGELKTQERGNFSFTERFAVKYAGAAAMYMVSKKLKKKYNITDARASLYDAANTWMEALNGRDFLGGSKPNLADLAVFGVLRPIRYLRAGKDMVENTQIGEWYQRMEAAVGEPSKIQE